MNLHQVLTGACNAGDHCFAVGSVEGIPFTAYAAGCDIVILASNFDRVQIIPGICHGNIQVVCLDCSTDRGKIAAAYGNQVSIFEPTPLIHQSSSHKLDYCWVQTGCFNADCHVYNLSWNLEGTRLLTGGDSIQLWHYNQVLEATEGEETNGENGIHFQVGGDADEEQPPTWQCIWRCKTANPVFHLKFSLDGSLFASAGKSDRLVKIWYEFKPVSFPCRSFDVAASISSLSSTTTDEVNYSFIYIAHPRAVTGLSWRKTSKYLPKGSVSNMLVTSCIDNICRIWVQTVLPDDGLVNLQQFDPMAAQNPKYRIHRHKTRFMVRLKHMKTCFHFRRRHASQHLPSNGPLTSPIPSLPSTLSSHDFHSFGLHGTGITPGFHFHLAASINAETDIPLVPSIGRRDNKQNFVLHWLNNKEIHFTLCAEQILQDLCKKAILQEHPESTHDQDNCDGDVNQEHEDDTKEWNASKKRSKRPKTKPVGHKLSAKSTKSVDEDGDRTTHSPVSNNSMPSTVSSSSISTDPSMGTTTPLGDALDRKIDALLRDWQQNPDLLFSVHPVDGSFLVWLVEWLDEYAPGTYRQAQVSFSSRIPSALPLGDAMSMSTSLILYNCKSFLDLKTVLDIGDGGKLPSSSTSDGGLASPPSYCGDEPQSPFTPSISMLSKHKNGTLNLWSLTFSESSKFTQVLSVGHQARVCGHRFRVNDITCHPVLPLLLTTSHHNLPKLRSPLGETSNCIPENEPYEEEAPYAYDSITSSGFCSELILWRIDPVSPLCKSGGVTELARINSPELSAFANVAWIPTLLPSTTLGSISNSPSACFVASDGSSLRIYQAVIDARTLLAELFNAERRKQLDDTLGSTSSSSSLYMGYKPTTLQDTFHIVSQQSTARPGCIIQLDSITDATHDWHNTQLLHVYQEQMITGEKEHGEETHGLLHHSMSAIVDLHHSSIFEEPFYLVVLEKQNKDTVLHMWRIVIASQPTGDDETEGMTYAPDSDIIQEGETSSTSSISNAVDVDSAPHAPSLMSPIVISTTKVCTQVLPLEDDVEIIHAAPAAGHLSSSSIYPACFAPYLICTACSDSKVRFWQCDVVTTFNGQHDTSASKWEYEWREWEMMINERRSSLISVPGMPLNVSCAYSGRIACAYKHGKSFTRPKSENPNNRYVNLCVAIYECESTGGSDWVPEDTIHLKNISLPEIKFNFDLRYVHDRTILEKKKQSLNSLVRNLSHEDQVPITLRDGEADQLCTNLHGLIAVPSFSTLQTLRKTICEKGNQFPLTQKHLVQLDWVSTEDGSHVLTIGVGSKILLFTAVGSDIAQANLKAMKESKTSNRPALQKASSMAMPMFNAEEVRWMKVRSIGLKTADGLPPLPMQISWVRDGILVVGMDNEMHVYSQWRDPVSCKVGSEGKATDFDESIDHRTLTDKDLMSLAHEASYHRLMSVKSHTSSVNLVGGADAKKKRELISKGLANIETAPGADIMPDYGLFEASRIACPVLPQYHPKQLIELLNFGKIRRVKAILSHLVRCLSGCGMSDPADSHKRMGSTGSSTSSRPRSWSRSRTMSISVPSRASPMDPQVQSALVSEDVQLDYVEINAIPPLPLYTLLAADRETTVPSGRDGERKKGYTGLFDSITVEGDETLDEILAEEFTGASRMERKHSHPGERQSLSLFGPRQARMLTVLLTHTHLPGLSSLDQMHLLALADTVATFNNEFSDKFTISSSKDTSARDSIISMEPAALDVSTDSLDDCGLRFLLAMRHQSYLQRCLPIAQRAQLLKKGLSPGNIVWAFHSESQEELVNMIPGMLRGSPKWSELRELGAGWWIRSNSTLRRCVEKVAKVAFQTHNKPMDAALFYLALKKKNILWGLFRSVNDSKMTEFFQHNFNEGRWRSAALKNAFVLLGKQRFHHAAAFFLLAGALSDAIKVCLTKLDDFQLAMVIIRLYEGDIDSCPPTLQQNLMQEVLGIDADGHLRLSNAHPDPFLRSMAYWLMKDYPSALSTLLQVQVGVEHPKFADEDLWCSPASTSAANPSVFNFYLYLRTHPLLIRQHITESLVDQHLPKVVPLSGFSHSIDVEHSVNGPSRQMIMEDAITPLERRLYFTTAHAHFKGGCPSLALEVLSKLPNKVMSPSVSRKSSNASFGLSKPYASAVNKSIDTGILDARLALQDADGEESQTGVRLDIMAQQLKFIACLKIVMEELSTLATGFEVDGGQLRYHLYIWLEQEVEALRELCNYGMQRQAMSTFQIMDNEKQGGQTPAPAFHLSDRPTLHEILLADKLDFEAKLQRAERRRRWLKANQTLLRTLLSYCCLHGASGGGLASVRMELILLLQELHQEKTQRQLLSPLPFPTTLPLLSASVACHKTVVTDPIRHLQSMTHDILHTMLGLHVPPSPGRVNYSLMFILRDLSIALASCIYQSLCDSESFSVKQNGYLSAGMAALASASVVYQDSHLMAEKSRRRRFSSGEDPVASTTPPSKWPGVTSLRALLAREKDEDAPKLAILLCETFFAVYMSLLVHALATCEAHTLYRLVAQKFSEKTWALLFGGGAKRELKVSETGRPLNIPQNLTEKHGSGEVSLLTTLSLQREKLHMKLFPRGPQSSPIKEDRPAYREQFVPPEVSMVSCLMTKPSNLEEYHFDYDSSHSIQSEESEDDDDDFDEDNVKDAKGGRKECVEHSDPNSYSWCLLRYAIVKVVQQYLQSFLNVVGLELQELPVASPLIHSILRILEHWASFLKDVLNKFGGPPANYIPGCFVEKISSGPAIQKYRGILEPHNTPFKSKHHSALPVKRLWQYLVRQEALQEIFIRYIFTRRKAPSSLIDDTVPADEPDDEQHQPDPIRVIHKDQDSISAFCISKTNNGIIALATTKELQELDISVLLEPPSWLEDECEYDLLNLRGTETLPSAEYLVVQTAADRPMLAQLASQGGSTASSAFSSPTGPSPSPFTSQTGRATTVLMKHKMDGVRRLSSHPLLPIYLSGGSDGSVRLWEWGHTQPLAMLRPPGSYAKVTRVRFNPQGNKFGVSDGDGTLSLWQVGVGTSANSAFFSMQCHSKQTSDFVFVSSSSLIATAGHSSEGKNVCLWDTLLPKAKAKVHAFVCHDQGCSCILYAPQHQSLISAGKKGFVTIFDVRQRQERHRFQAHETATKCLALDPAEEFIVTGSADGDIKIWGLTLYNCVFNFAGEHTKNSFFRNISPGVSQLYVDANNRLFSCGADGSMKLRQLPERDLVLSYY